MIGLELNFIDRGYITKDNKFAVIQEKKCMCCHENSEKGFDIKNDYPVNPIFHKSVRGSTIGFVCINCIFDFLKKQGYSIKDSKEIFKLNFDVPKKYSQIYLRYKQGKFPQDDFMNQKEKFKKIMPEVLIEAIEYLTELDLEYSENIHRGTEWKGWWMGLTGDEVKIFFSWLQSAITHNYDNLIERFKSEFNTHRTHPAIYQADKVYREVKEK